MPGKKKFRKRQTRKKPSWQLEIAKERIDILFRQAKEEFENRRPDLANRYVGIARKIGTKYNVPLTGRKKDFCKSCGHYLVAGKNSTTRLIPERKIIKLTCLDCGFSSVFGYAKKRES